MRDKEGSTIVTIPEQIIRTCGDCKYYKFNMVRSGLEPKYSQNCEHPEAKYPPSIFGSGNLNNHPVMHIVETPEWCPFLKDTISIQKSSDV